MKACKKRRQRAIGSFEAMENRKLFAVDLIGVGDVLDGEAVSRAEMEELHTQPTASVGDYGKPNPEDDGPLGPIGPVVQIVERAASDSILSELGYPNPEDDGPLGPIGPVVHTVEQLASQNVLSELGYPNPEDDGPLGPIGPVVHTVDQMASQNMMSDVGYPNPEDDGPLGPIGPVVHAERAYDFSDFLNLSKNFGKREAMRAHGDLNGDTIVNFRDFLLLSANFGTSIPPADADAAFA